MKKASNVTPLCPEDWAFHKIPEDEHHAAFIWEISREVAGKGVAWLNLCERDKADWLSYHKDDPIREIPLYTNPLITPDREEIWMHWKFHQVDSEQYHLFNIRWDRSKKKILKAFEEWLYSQNPPSPKIKRFARSDSGGRPAEFSGLVNLAIYRAVEHGYTRVKAIELLEPLLAKAEIQFTNSDSKVSAKHWSKCLASIQKAIDAHPHGDANYPQINYYTAKNP
jgi:hypothetical protein